METITFPEFIRRNTSDNQLDDPNNPIDGTPEGYIRAARVFVHNLEHLGVDDGVFDIRYNEDLGEFVADFALRTESEWAAIEQAAIRKDLENQLRSTADQLFGPGKQVHVISEEGIDILEPGQS